MTPYYLSFHIRQPKAIKIRFYIGIFISIAKFNYPTGVN